MILQRDIMKLITANLLRLEYAGTCVETWSDYTVPTHTVFSCDIVGLSQIIVIIATISNILC